MGIYNLQDLPQTVPNLSIGKQTNLGGDAKVTKAFHIDAAISYLHAGYVSFIVRNLPGGADQLAHRAAKRQVFDKPRSRSGD